MLNFIGHFLSSDEPTWIEEVFNYIKDNYFTPDLNNYDNLNISIDNVAYIRLIILGLFTGVIIAAFMSIFNKRTLGNFVRKIISDECFDKDSAKTLSQLGYMKNSAVRGSLKSGVTLKRVVRCVEEEEYYKQFGIEPRPVKVLEEIIHGDKKEQKQKAGEEKSVKTELEEKAELQEPAKAEQEQETKIQETAETEAETAKKDSNLNIPRYKVDLNNDHFYIAKNESYMADVKFEAKGANWFAFGFIIICSVASAILIFKYLPDFLQLLDNFLDALKSDNNTIR